MDFIACLREEARYTENALISVLDSRPRYLKRIPKKFYVRHFLEIHKQNSRPQIKITEKGGYNYSISVKVRIYDKIRKRYIKF